MSEFKTTEEKLEVLVDLIEELVGQLQEDFSTTFKKLEKNLDAIGSIADDKTIKGVSSFNTLFQKMGASDPAVLILERLLVALEPLFMLFEPFMVVFEILGSLLEVFASEILMVLFDAMQPVFDLLLQLTPIFQVLGKLVGFLIEILLFPLKVIIAFIMLVFKNISPILQLVADILTVLGKAISVIVRIAILPLVILIYSAVYMFATIVDGITWLLDVADIFNLTPIRQTHFKSWTRKTFRPIINMLTQTTEFARGGIVTKPTIGEIGEGNEPELVVPLSKSREVFGHLDEVQLNEASEKLSLLITLRKRNEMIA
ncbi:MAG: hypothetical protein OEL89_00020 [Candidatus Peregrinibacteria bacterium]|nr:hypothetical protein [Candidatus Peregrinibacteria bacterium]